VSTADQKTDERGAIRPDIPRTWIQTPVGSLPQCADQLAIPEKPIRKNRLPERNDDVPPISARFIKEIKIIPTDLTGEPNGK